MQATLQTAPETFKAAFKTGATKPGSWIILIVAALLLPFASGGHAIALAAWLAPFFLLRFTRSRDDDRCSYRSGSANGRAHHPVSRNGPFPTPIYIAVMVFLWLLLPLPYLGRQTLVAPAPGYGDSRFSLLLTSIEYLLSLGPFGSWFATPIRNTATSRCYSCFHDRLVRYHLPHRMERLGWKCLMGGVDGLRAPAPRCGRVRSRGDRGDTGRRCPAGALPTQRSNRAGRDAVKDRKGTASRSKGCWTFLSARAFDRRGNRNNSGTLSCD